MVRVPLLWVQKLCHLLHRGNGEVVAEDVHYLLDNFEVRLGAKNLLREHDRADEVKLGLRSPHNVPSGSHGVLGGLGLLGRYGVLLDVLKVFGVWEYDDGLAVGNAIFVGDRGIVSLGKVW